MSKRAIVLVRVSTEDQDVDNQIPGCVALAEKLGFEVKPDRDVFREVVSGTKGAMERPGLRRVMALASDGSIGAVVVWALDRIGRNMWDVIDRFRELESLGVRVYSVSEGWTVDCPEDFRPLLLAQAAWWAGMERRRIVERVRAGLQRTRKAGTHLGRVRKLPTDQIPLAWSLFLGGASWAEVAVKLGERWNRTTIATAASRWARAEGLILGGETAHTARDRLRAEREGENGNA